MADPDYDLGADRIAAETRRITEGQQELAALTFRGGRVRSGGLGRQRWVRLAGTAREAKAISPILTRYIKSSPTVYTGSRALEGVFKKASSPQVVVLSTHGFALPEQDYSTLGGETGKGIRGTVFAARKHSRPKSGKVANIENPLLRCGLVLAGANNRKAIHGADDGVLTGLEIVGTNLRGTDLVVLSACETGVGKVQNGEGVAGLRQAFQLAGAKTVDATLWKIPDNETVDLMTGFWGNLAAGQSKADALRNAQLAMIRKLRAKDGTANPFFWAAFTLTGDWRYELLKPARQKDRPRLHRTDPYKQQPKVRREAGASEGDFIKIVRVSQDDNRYPKIASLANGLRIKVKDTDKSPLDADMEVYLGQRRIGKFKDLRKNSIISVMDRFSNTYEIVILDIFDSEETVTVGLRKE